MSELTAEEKELLAGADAEPRKPRGRRKHEVEAPAAPEPAPAPAKPARGPHTPAQWDDDGWGDTPIQMRG